MESFKQLVLYLLIVSFYTTCILGQNKEKKFQPNIVIFYVDDLGWQDIELNNLDDPTPWETPNILKLAKEGFNFTNGYSPAPTCAPSRCAMLTGLHPVKTRVTHVAGGLVPQKKYSNYIEPFYPLGLRPENFTIAEALKENGYTTGHIGKWHAGSLEIQKSSNQGFDFTFESRGAHQGPKTPYNRLTKFATHDKNDPYRLSYKKYPPFTKESPDGISYPKDDVTEKALEFIDKNKNEPFFLYLAHWLVHTPIHTKNRELLQYYSNKLNVDFPTENIPVSTDGQTNPFYGSMVTTLDWSLGCVVDLLKKTDDPRNPGKKLYETTYIFFSSDNGGCEKSGKEIITDNFPLDKGKKYAQEGGIRVPMIITGPNIPKGKNYDGLVNQLDFFPTIINLTQSKIAEKDKLDLDGLDITGVLLNNEKVIKNNEGKPREDLWWHFPHNKEYQMQSAIRAGDYKLYKNLTKGDYELYRLYKDGYRDDLEEQYDIAEQNPKVVKDLSTRLEKYLKEYGAKYPYKSPTTTKKDEEFENVSSIPVVVDDSFDTKTGKFIVNLRAGRREVIESYALIKIGDPLRVNKNRNTAKRRKHSTTYIKTPIDVSENKLTYTLNVPIEALEYGMVFINKDRFMVKSEFHKAN